MRPVNTKGILRSAQRLAEAETFYNRAQNDIKRVWLAFLRRESNVLVRRAIKLWLKLRFR